MKNISKSKSWPTTWGGVKKYKEIETVKISLDIDKKKIEFFDGNDSDENQCFLRGEINTTKEEFSVFVYCANSCNWAAIVDVE